MLELLLRVVVSTGVVLGLFFLLARTSSKKLGGRGRQLMRVHGRQSLTRGASMAVVEVGSRVLVVGVSDNGVRLLTELDPEELDLPVDASGDDGDESAQAVESSADELAALDQLHVVRRRVPAGGARRAVSTSPVAGSMLDAATWKQAWAAATKRHPVPDAPRDGDAA